MAPIPETSEWSGISQQWMAMALGAVLTACVSLSIALIVLLCGGGEKKEEKKEDAPPPAEGGEAPKEEAPKEEAPKEPSNKEPSNKAPAGGSQKDAKSAVSAKGQSLKLTSEKPGASGIGKAGGKSTIDLKKQQSLQLQTAKK